MGKYAFLFVVASLCTLSMLAAAKTCQDTEIGAFVNTMHEKLKVDRAYTSLMNFLRSKKSVINDFATCVQENSTPSKKNNFC